MLFKRTLKNGKKSKTWSARYRGADGRRIERSTGCKSKRAAQARLSGWEKEEERAIAGVVTLSEAETSKWAKIPLKKHITDYKTYMEARGLHKDTIGTRCYHLNTIVTKCRFHSFSDISQSQVERWLLDQIRNENMGLRTHNAYVAACTAFGNWAVKQGRLLVNPFAGLSKQNERLDRRRIRRVFTPEELVQLFEAAEYRPLHEAMFKPVRTQEKGVSKIPDEPANLEPATKDSLQWLGYVRSMAYKTMAYTGLRFGELHSITIGQCRLDQEPVYLELKAVDEKAKRGAQLPIPMFFVDELKHYHAGRIKRLTGGFSAFPSAYNGKPLFDLPPTITRIFNNDLVFAGLASKVTDENGNVCIEKKNERGESLDVHSLRHTFITNLALSGASMVTVAKAARHSDPKLTLGVYSHVNLAELSEAVSILPNPTDCKTVQVVNAGEERVSPKVSPIDVISLQNTSIYCTISEKEGVVIKYAETPVNIGFSGEKDGAGHGVRTRDIQLGKLALYQLS